jgi:hypothetical protein
VDTSRTKRAATNVIRALLLSLCVGGIALSWLEEAGVSARQSCPAARVNYSRTPAGGLSGIPWVAASPRTAGGVAYLFFYGERPFKQQHLATLAISTRGRTAEGSTKILWWLPRGGAKIFVTGRRIDGAGSFRMTLNRASAAPEYPSIVKVPTAGCWRVQFGTRIHSAIVIMRAVDL